MSLEKALEIKHEFNIDTVTEVIMRAFDYQHIFNVSYDRGLDCVRAEYRNKYTSK